MRLLCARLTSYFTVDVTLAREGTLTGGNKTRFTLRFSDEATPEALRLVAKARKKSMNALIEEMVERELPREVNAIEAELSETLAALRRYRGSAEQAWARFAAAEGHVQDPIRAERIVSEPDPYGVNAAFA